MKRAPALVALVLVSAFAASVPAQEARVVIDEFTVSRWVTDNMQALNIPSIAVGIVGPTEDYYLQAYGPAELDQPFLIGSLTKSVTAMAVMLLVHDGKLALSDSASQWVAGVPQAVTVQHLLNQTSGLSRADGAGGWTDLDRTVEEMVRGATFDPPGSFSYSNLNYQILGRIVEEVSGKAYADFVQQRVFGPAGMNHTTASATRPEGRVTGYQYVYGWPVDFDEPDYNPHTIPSGFVWMSPNDMARWLRLFVADGVLDGKQVVPKEVVAKLLEKPANTNYAMGWLIRTSEEPHVAKHSGETGAFTSAMAVVPERKFGIFVMTNVNAWMGGTPTNVLNGLKASILGTERPTVTNLEFVLRLGFGIIVALVLFTFFVELVRWMHARFPLRLNQKERKAVIATVVFNIVVVVAVTQYFETPISVMIAIQPDIGYGFLILVVPGTIRRILSGFLKTMHLSIVSDDE